MDLIKLGSSSRNVSAVSLGTPSSFGDGSGSTKANSVRSSKREKLARLIPRRRRRSAAVEVVDDDKYVGGDKIDPEELKLVDDSGSDSLITLDDEGDAER